MIFPLMVLDFAATFFGNARALFPIYARDILFVGPKGLGVLYAARAVGSLFSAGTMSLFGPVRQGGRWILIGVGIYGVATVLFAGSHVFWFSVLMLAITGASDTVSTVLRQTIRQLVTPDYLRGRMTSVNMIFFMGGPQLGELEAGAVAAVIGASLSVVTGGLGCLIAAGIAAIWAKSLLSYERE